jgi:hypothetical protein
MMSKSVRSTAPQFEKQKVPRFRRLDNDHISAIESLFKQFPFLNERVEIHMPFSRAKSTFSSGTVWLWPKFDKRPVGYLIFIEGFAPCIWYPERQEGMTFRWLLPPNFSQKGATVCFANILAGESVLQIEDITIYEGKDMWSNLPYSERWNKLRDFWQSLPADQPLLAFKPRVVKPITLSQWALHYDSSIYWIIQPDHSKQPRWFWKDTVTVPEHNAPEFIAPQLKRSADIHTILVAHLTHYAGAVLPDTYSLYSQEGVNLGVASISTLDLSLNIRKTMTNRTNGISVEVKWNADFNKYQVMRIMPEDTPVTTASFFYHNNQMNL